jgi:hypothetical protein
MNADPKNPKTARFFWFATRLMFDTPPLPGGFFVERKPAMIVTGNVVTRQEVVCAIQELAEKLERRPTLPELCAVLKTTPRRVKRLFGTYAQAVRDSGLVPLVKGTLRMEALFDDWRNVVRKRGKIPTVHEYAMEGKYSARPLTDRFGGWKDVAEGMLRFGDQRESWAGWEDVRELAQHYVEERKRYITVPKGAFGSEPTDPRTVYGAPLTDSPMVTEPTNELGVVLLFGALARQLGFAVLKLQAQYPDCEALRQADDCRWQRIRIEFEFESGNFANHGHDPKGCDLIVCWKHTWEGCGIQVLELSKVAHTL